MSAAHPDGAVSLEELVLPCLAVGLSPDLELGWPAFYTAEVPSQSTPFPLSSGNRRVRVLTCGCSAGDSVSAEGLCEQCLHAEVQGDEGDWEEANACNPNPGPDPHCNAESPSSSTQSWWPYGNGQNALVPAELGWREPNPWSPWGSAGHSPVLLPAHPSLPNPTGELLAPLVALLLGQMG